MIKIILTIFLLLFSAISVKTQTITDEDRRAFDDLRIIEIDLDGDGKTDTIQPRTYQRSIKQISKKMHLRKSHIQNWITFDLITAKGKRINSFFKYNYGTDEQGGSYWVYALISAGDINRDGKTDLVFYSGDDTTDETIKLINKRNKFIVYSRKHTTNAEW
ncbi:MAG: hypothetical protein M3388_12980 [Acidobacteriota bacterium]|nr:hypothetical protein [Acidobacteriota bacterium]